MKVELKPVYRDNGEEAVMKLTNLKEKSQMKPFFEYDTEVGMKSLLSRARKVALRALQQYDLDWNGIRFVQVSDSITYKIETDSNDKFLLRIHSDKLTKEEINSEILFLNELCHKYGLMVPVGVEGLNGSYVYECETEEGYQKPTSGVFISLQYLKLNMRLIKFRRIITTTVLSMVIYIPAMLFFLKKLPTPLISEDVVMDTICMI